jgi:uncharacterized protein with gpF-like domain
MTKVTRRNAAQTHARSLRLLAIEENRAARAWAKLLRSYAQRFARAYAANGADGLAREEIAYAVDVNGGLETNWRGAMVSFATQTQTQLSKFRTFSLSVKAKKTTLVDRAVQEWVATYTAEKVRSITKTAMENIRAVISEGVNAGWSNDKIAAAIEAKLTRLAPYDALRIAKTETHAAAMAGADAGARATGLEMEKQWLSSGDDRTRASHAAVDGQTVGLNELFTVGGERLEYPGDPAGSAANVIQCRCTLLYVPKD